MKPQCETATDCLQESIGGIEMTYPTPEEIKHMADIIRNNTGE